ncbi:hypothetical protein V8E55_002495 [Tylopilus felleus]
MALQHGRLHVQDRRYVAHHWILLPALQFDGKLALTIPRSPCRMTGRWPRRQGQVDALRQRSGSVGADLESGSYPRRKCLETDVVVAWDSPPIEDSRYMNHTSDLTPFSAQNQPSAIRITLLPEPPQPNNPQGRRCRAIAIDSVPTLPLDVAGDGDGISGPSTYQILIVITHCARPGPGIRQVVRNRSPHKPRDHAPNAYAPGVTFALGFIWRFVLLEAWAATVMATTRSLGHRLPILGVESAASTGAKYSNTRARPSSGLRMYKM